MNRIDMEETIIQIIGLVAGGITSIGFLPQIIQGYKTKKLDDVSIYMPLVLAAGMTLWFIYGFLLNFKLKVYTVVLPNITS